MAGFFFDRENGVTVQPMFNRTALQSLQTHRRRAMLKLILITISFALLVTGIVIS